jgi:hypothetical protein
VKRGENQVRAHVKVVAFMQERASRRVLATSATAVPEHP